VKLSIITVTLNNAPGLEKTLASVNSQAGCDFEHIVVDGASSDGSCDVIRRLSDGKVLRRWLSEPDTGIYNAMNKGIAMASGEYVQILNAGDTFCNAGTVRLELEALDKNGRPELLCGNMVKCWPDGKRYVDKGASGEHTMLYYYKGTLNHNSCLIRRDLFERFGKYDEKLKICSDWEWFVKAVPLGGVSPVYVDLDMTCFDMCGISESGGLNAGLISEERSSVLEALLPPGVRSDYDRYSGDIMMLRRLRRHAWAFAMVRFLERCLFKWEKWTRS